MKQITKQRWEITHSCGCLETVLRGRNYDRKDKDIRYWRCKLAQMEQGLCCNCQQKERARQTTARNQEGAKTAIMHAHRMLSQPNVGTNNDEWQIALRSCRRISPECNKAMWALTDYWTAWEQCMEHNDNAERIVQLNDRSAGDDDVYIAASRWIVDHQNRVLAVYGANPDDGVADIPGQRQ